MRVGWASWVAVAALGSSACALDVEPELSDTRLALERSKQTSDDPNYGIVNGTLATSDPAVVALLDRGEQFCTGTVIAPTVVLTAAHCLPPNHPVQVADMRVFIGADTHEPGVDIAVTATTSHPQWQRDWLGYDIGLIQLAEVAPVAPLPVLSDALTVADEGLVVRVIGYGRDALGSPSHHQRRAGFAEIRAIDPFSMYLSASPATTCHGDSGGPALLSRNGVRFVAGVHSRSDCTNESVEERTDIHVEHFIEPYIVARGECVPGTGCAAPCELTGSCLVTCDRLGRCDRPEAGFRPAVDDPGCSVGGNAPGGCAFVALALLAIALRRLRP